MKQRPVDSPDTSQTRLHLLAVDLCLIAAAYLLALLLMPDARPGGAAAALIDLAVLMTAGALLTLIPALRGGNDIDARTAALTTLRAALIAGAGMVSATWLSGSGLAAHVFVVFAMIYLLASAAARLLRGGTARPETATAAPDTAPIDAILSSFEPRAARAPLDLDHLLGRDGLDADLPGVAESYEGRCILVTGAGGSIGSELCRQILGCNPSCLVLMDHAEWALFQIDRELRDMAPGLEIAPVLGSVCERDLVTGVMAKYKVDIVLHAAAYKHVPLVEYNALEGLRNNVLGTKVVADAAREAGVERFILVSTDKAVRPSSVMGASKRFAELLIQDLATRSPTTRFSMVRFGNVLGSSGSVIPLFEEQIARGGPVTLTHNDITRYFMTIPEAVKLVLLAGSFARGGDVFVLDMGEPIPIRQVAQQMIERAGLTVRDEANPGGDIEILVTGLRPGEKLHEELLIGSDMLTTPHPKILRAQEDHLSEIEMANALSSLRFAIEERDIETLNMTLSKWIERHDDADQVIVNE